METTDGIQLEAVLEALPNLSIAELNTVEALLVKLREEKETEQRRQFLATMKKAAKEAGLDFESMIAAEANKKKKTKSEPKYRHPSDPGKTWTGRGKGRAGSRPFLTVGRIWKQ